MSGRGETEPRFIVVVGTSAGGIRALEELVMQLKPEMDAAFFLVLHLSPKGGGKYLFQRLQDTTTLQCKVAENGEPIRKGVIYIAPPDEHLLVTDWQVIVGKGAPENRWRPSINNLFRSAAATFNSRVIGIILTGMLDDGASGMAAIKSSGGVTIVQDPKEADYPDMPLSVLDTTEVDHIISLSKIGSLLTEIAAHTEPVPVEVPAHVTMESAIGQRISTRMENVAHFERIEVNCPDCGSGLYIATNEHPAHYRCHMGHSYTDRELVIRLFEAMENTFWTSLRMMEERQALLLKLAKKDQERGYVSTANRHLEKAKEMEGHIGNLKQILFAASQAE